jgi:uncharacterized protein (TIGR04255 family)
MPRDPYDKPPIEEATCQLAFSEPVPWGPETARQLFEKVRGLYPSLPMQQQVLQANLVAAPTAAVPNLTLAPTERVVFADESGESRLSVSAGIIAIHRIRPYVSFDGDMLPRIKRDVPVVANALGSAEFKSVSVRYVNKIEIGDKNFDLNEYFTYWGAQELLPPPFEGTVSAFLYRTEAQEASSPLSLTLTFGSVAAPKDNSAFVLDIDLTYNFETPEGIDSAVERIAAVKNRENEIFESLITEKTRRLFR